MSPDIIVFKKNFSSKRKPQKTQDMLNLHKKYTLYCMFLSTGFLEKNCFLKRKNKKIKIKIVKLRNHFITGVFMSKAKLIYKQK